MAGLSDDAQWIVMMGFIISFSFFFLAMIINQSTVVGQTTAESVLDFPKNDIRDVRSAIINSSEIGDPGYVHNDIVYLAQFRKNAIVNYTCNPMGCTEPYTISIHYNNGVTAYNETWVSS